MGERTVDGDRTEREETSVYRRPIGSWAPTA